ncbi:hypothetical protein AR687_24865 [Flavobacteriaceae bacterium CRH]|nr:hypothetical protein AR687_24865 [Flavobacteriaceae bacterium CRH]
MRLLNKLSHIQLLYVSLLIIILVSIAFLIDNHRKTVALEKEIIRIDRKIHLNEVTLHKRQKRNLDMENKKQTDSLINKFRK